MRVLALDTTTQTGSLALLEGERVLEQRAGDAARTQAERLPLELVALVERHGLTLRDIDLFGVALGPGTFTGLRIGIATIQGLAFVGDRPVVGVPALDALAHAVAGDVAAGGRIATWMDARRRDVFAAVYTTRAAEPFSPERLEPIDGPVVDTPAVVLDRASSDVDLFVGDGALLYREQIRAARPRARVSDLPLLAAVIARIALVRAARGEASTAAALQPLYVRRPDAELDREKRASPVNR